MSSRRIIYLTWAGSLLATRRIECSGRVKKITYIRQLKRFLAYGDFFILQRKTDHGVLVRMQGCAYGFSHTKPAEDDEGFVHDAFGTTEIRTHRRCYEAGQWLSVGKSTDTTCTNVMKKRIKNIKNNKHVFYIITLVQL